MKILSLQRMSFEIEWIAVQISYKYEYKLIDVLENLYFQVVSQDDMAELAFLKANIINFPPIVQAVNARLEVHYSG